MKELYFIALIPPAEVCEEVKQLKEEMKARFGAKHALKSPAHITLQMPFRKEEETEAALFQSLKKAASACRPFRIELNGFDCFRPKVLFIRVVNHEDVQRTHLLLRPYLVEDVGLPEKQVLPHVHPHMTIATRDLSGPAFYRAWPEFSGRAFEASFEVRSFFLLKHNGKFWDVYREFSFSDSNGS